MEFAKLNFIHILMDNVNNYSFLLVEIPVSTELFEDKK